MKNILASLFIILSPLAVMAQKTTFEKSDSARIETMLLNADSGIAGGELLLAIANCFIDEKYVGGPLEQSAEEVLFISCTELDCTTYVELVLAIAKTVNDGSHRFADVCRNLETIRYRNGKNRGYASRLHYISWWIADSAKTGMIEDVTSQISNERQPLNINFMSNHSCSYPRLAENPKMVKEIERMEIPYRGIEVS